MGYLFLVIGIFTVGCTYYKPDFYWESRKAKRTRKLFRDKGTEILYYTVGIAAFVGGILEIANIISLDK